MTMRLCDLRNRHYYYAEADAAQSTEGAMKILFLATAAYLVLSLSSSAQEKKRPISTINIAFRTAQITAQIQEKMASLIRRIAIRNA